MGWPALSFCADAAAAAAAAAAQKEAWPVKKRRCCGKGKQNEKESEAKNEKAKMCENMQGKLALLQIEIIMVQVSPRQAGRHVYCRIEVSENEKLT